MFCFTQYACLIYISIYSAVLLKENGRNGKVFISKYFGPACYLVESIVFCHQSFMSFVLHCILVHISSPTKSHYEKANTSK